MKYSFTALDVEHDIVSAEIKDILNQTGITDVDVLPKEMIRVFENLRASALVFTKYFLLLLFFCLIFVLKKKKLLIGIIAGRHVSWSPRYSDDPGSVQ